jgi:hypothetical protein
VGLYNTGDKHNSKLPQSRGRCIILQRFYLAAAESIG